MTLFYGSFGLNAGCSWKVACDRQGCKSIAEGPHTTSNQSTTIRWLRDHGWVLGRRKQGYQATCPRCKAGIPPGSSSVKRTYSVGGTTVTRAQFEKLQSTEGYAHHRAFYKLRDGGQI